jgi:hypothetical protein
VALLLAASALPPDTPVLIAEPVRWRVEYRCFVLERTLATMSPYVRDGDLAQDANGACLLHPMSARRRRRSSRRSSPTP